MQKGAESRLASLTERLQTLQMRFNREMLARGFDPAQAETTALPTSLASLAGEMQTLQAEIDAIQQDTNII